MSLVPITVDVQRDTAAADAYGGKTLTSATIYTGLSATFNYYPSRGGRAERERFESLAQIRGPGVQTRTQGVVIFDPKPSGVTVANSDRIAPNPAVHGVPAALNVIAVREYEFTLQVDVEAVA
jgi:hypothetical protein